MPKIGIFLAVGAVISSLGLSACTSTGDNMVPSLALASTADLALPDSVSVVPSSFAASPDGAVATAGASAPAVNEAAYAAAPAADASLAVARAVHAPENSAESPAPVATKAVYTPPAPATANIAGNDVDGLIAKYAAVYEVPVELVRRVVKRESTFNPRAYNRGHWGLMQIKHATARGMGYTGSAKGLLDAETNLKYAVKYLKGALLVADGNHDLADRLYQRGYYYDAKRKGLLEETGLGKDRRKRMPSSS